jgi:hypothetical protein
VILVDNEIELPTGRRRRRSVRGFSIRDDLGFEEVDGYNTAVSLEEEVEVSGRDRLRDTREGSETGEISVRSSC